MLLNLNDISMHWQLFVMEKQDFPGNFPPHKCDVNVSMEEEFMKGCNYFWLACQWEEIMKRKEEKARSID